MKKKVFLPFFILLFIPVIVSAQSVDILWQGDSYTPPFYKGRALWSTQSRINLTAIPHGLGNSANLNYKWTKNGTVLGSVSGFGRNTLSFDDPIISRPQNIKVDIISGQNTILASESIVVAPVVPTLTIYENNPLLGFMFHKETVGTHELQDREVTFTAFPFFFSATSRISNNIRYEWSSNAGNPETENSVTYRTPEDAAGISRIIVNVTNVNKITQNANRNFLIEFGDENIN
jgi:hypothetical protein